MGLFGWGRKRAAVLERVEPGQAVGGGKRFQFLSGRRHVADAPYVLPKDNQEIQRLDFQHYMLRYALRGNYAAPLRNPMSILDVGCGTGRWAVEMAALFPGANVVGVDLVPPPVEDDDGSGSGPSKRPENFAFAQGDILKGLAFADRSFDYVHMRLLVFALPAPRWQDVANELVRVARPGGWVEWLEGDILLKDGGPAVEKLNHFARMAGKGRGIDPTYVYRIGEFLRQGGVANVQTHQVNIPMHTFAGRLGQMGATDYLAVIGGLKGPLTAQKLVSPEEFDQTVQEARREMDHYKVIATFPMAWGQRSN